VITIIGIRRGFPRGFFRAGLLACLLSTAFAMDAAAQSLREELRELIRAHPRIENMRAQVRESDEVVRQSRAGFLPNLSATGSFGAEMVSNPSTRLANTDNEKVRSNALGLELRQPLYDGGLAWNDTDAALLQREAGARALDLLVQEVTLDGTLAYIQILRLSELIRVARARERTIRKQEDLETERVERGAGIEVDVLQAKSRLQLAIEARVDLEGQLRSAVARYITLFQRQPDITRMRLDPIPVDFVPEGLDEALYIASTQNPRLSSLEFLTRAARVNVDVQRSAFFPSLDLVGRWDHESNTGGTRNVTKEMAVLLEMSWEIFAGFRNEATVAAAREALIQSLTSADNGVREVKEQVRQAWSKLENTRMRKELLINAVSIAQEVFSARQQLRDIGKATSLEVLDAENEVFQAEQNLIRADYDNRAAAYELAFAMGRLSPAVLDLDIEIIEDGIEQYLIEPDEVDERPPQDIELRRPSPQGEGDPISVPSSLEGETGGAVEPEPSEPLPAPDDGEASVIESPPDDIVPLQEQLQEGALDPIPPPGGKEIAVVSVPDDPILPSTASEISLARDAVAGDALAGRVEQGLAAERNDATQVLSARPNELSDPGTPDPDTPDPDTRDPDPAAARSGQSDARDEIAEAEAEAPFSFFTDLFTAGYMPPASARPEDALSVSETAPLQTPARIVSTTRAEPVADSSEADMTGDALIDTVVDALGDTAHERGTESFAEGPTETPNGVTAKPTSVQSATLPFAAKPLLEPVAETVTTDTVVVEPGIAVSGGIPRSGFEVPGSVLFGASKDVPR
jgi:adhesin transport system outer membrane protein